MSPIDPRDLESGLELERYELDERPFHEFELSRRNFLQTVGAGFVVLLTVTGAGTHPLLAQDRRRGGRRGRGLPDELGAWLHVAEDGGITVYTGKTEVGQNIRTSLTQAVAEELRVPLDRIEIVMGDTERVPFDMGTFGSLTTPLMASHLRRAAASAREMIAEAAAEEWKVDRATVVVAEGKVTASSGQSASFGELTRGRKLTRTVSAGSEPAAAKDWKISGQSIPKVNGEAMVTGAHHYTSDLRREGMLIGKILRPAAFDAKLVSCDTSRAEALDGVTVVRDGDFIGVTAPTEPRAIEALEAIDAEWSHTDQPSQDELFRYLKENRTSGGGWRRGRPIREGSVEKGLEAADVTLESQYTIAYIAHAPLEPRAALAEWTANKLTVWNGTQRPFGVKSQLVEAFGLTEDQVRVIVPDTGSGYGGKHTGEAALEAARLSRAAGKPVRVVWTREEEFTWAYFRPAGVIDVRSGVTRAGDLTAWKYENYNSGGSGMQTYYEVPNQDIESHATRSPLRQGSYRALASTANHFAREMHMDELAHEIGMDPLAFRLRNLKNERLRGVFEAAAERFDWKKERGTRRGIGIAGGYDKRGYVASCAEVEKTRGGTIRIRHVVTAFDCGAVVNPTHLEGQIEGAVIMGLGGALWEEIEFAAGQVLNPRFSRYRVPRFKDIPRLETVLVNRKDKPSAGAGETPIVAVAPAIGNAIRALTGKSLRSLPMRLGDLG